LFAQKARHGHSLRCSPTDTHPTTSDRNLDTRVHLGNVARGGCWHLAEDGTFRQARRRDALDNSPFAICEVWFEGTQLFVGQCTVSGVPPCEDAIATYEVRLLEGGGIEIVTIEDACSPRRLDTATVYHAVP
jgi:hypothetical protein